MTSALGHRLRIMRKANGCTLQTVAEATGLSVSFISDIELGKAEPSLETLRKLAHAYGRRVHIVVESNEVTIR